MGRPSLTDLSANGLAETEAAYLDSTPGTEGQRQVVRAPFSPGRSPLEAPWAEASFLLDIGELNDTLYETFVTVNSDGDISESEFYQRQGQQRIIIVFGRQGRRVPKMYQELEMRLIFKGKQAPKQFFFLLKKNHFFV